MKFMAMLVVVEDVNRAREFYEAVLGQKVVADFGENVSFAAGFSIHKEDHFKNLIVGREVAHKSNSFELYFEENNLEVVVEKIKDLNLEFIHEIVEQPWKQRVIRFYDYDKNIIEVGEEMEYVAYRLHTENYSLEEISEFTYMDIEMIKVAINKFS